MEQYRNEPKISAREQSAETETEQLNELSGHLDDIIKTIKDNSAKLAAEAQDYWKKNVTPKISTDKEGLYHLPWPVVEGLIHQTRIEESDISDDMKHLYSDESDISFGIDTQKIGRVYELLNLLETSSKFEPGECAYLSQFIGHDRQYGGPKVIPEFLAQAQRAADRPGQAEISEITLTPEHFTKLEQAIQEFAPILAFSAFPFECLQSVLKEKMGQKSEKKEVNLPNDIIKPMLKVLEMRFSELDLTMLINPSKEELEKPGNKIILNVQEKEIDKLMLDPGLFISTIYNLVKNAGKALEEKNAAVLEKCSPFLAHYQPEREGAREAKEINANIQVDIKQQNDNLDIIVSDTGYGINVDKLLKSIADKILSLDPAAMNQDLFVKELTDVIGEHSAQLLLGWPEEPFNIRQIHLGDVFDLALLARVGGFEQPESSGLGLWGVRYITQKLKGKIIGTNACGSGAVFKVSIPLTSLQ